VFIEGREPRVDLELSVEGRCITFPVFGEPQPVAKDEKAIMRANEVTPRTALGLGGLRLWRFGSPPLGDGRVVSAISSVRALALSIGNPISLNCFRR